MPSDTTAPRPPILAGDHHFVSVMIAAILAVVGGLALLALKTTPLTLAFAMLLLVGTTGALTVAIFRLLAHDEHEPDATA
ncbi:MAG: hypothetical protein MUC84_06685 [Solirubrobacteraceae bacterium]|jgi:hypothetical protein|nr:hypothetical protein [Solirubrobacteraceae bacterium]MCU0313733.1 hypothetical protein [Solirubrobacteraceae bacterium]